MFYRVFESKKNKCKILLNVTILRSKRRWLLRKYSSIRVHFPPILSKYSVDQNIPVLIIQNSKLDGMQRATRLIRMRKITLMEEKREVSSEKAL